MGNTAMSCGGFPPESGQVRILQADGKMLHFAHPILAIQVMQEHPGHILVNCGPSSLLSEMILEGSYASLTYERIREMSSKYNIAMLRADEVLDSRSTYYLLPMQAKKQAGAWSKLVRALKTSGKVASSFEVECKKDCAGAERKFSRLRRSRSVPRSRESLQQEEEEQQQQQQPKALTQSISFPSRTGEQRLGNPFLEGVGLCRELPLTHLQTVQNKRPRRVRSRSHIPGWKPILESISEVVDDERDDINEDFSGHFYRTQSKCLRRLHSFDSHPHHLSTTAHFRPVAV